MTPMLASLVVDAVPLVVVLLVGATDAWVYVDARARADLGDPVTVSIGAARIDTPLAWLVCCVVLWLISFPLYLAARRGVA